MNKLNFLYVFIFVSCLNLPRQDIGIDECAILHSILDLKEVNSLMGLSDATNPYPYIRIFDLSGSFSNCRSKYRSADLDFFISYHVENELRPSINTGTFRDLVIQGFEIDHLSKIGRMKLSIASFQSYNNVNTNFKISIKFDSNEETFRILQTKVTEFVPPTKPYSYDTNE